MLATFFARQRLTSLLHDEPNNRQRGRGVHPPRAKQKVGNESDHHNQRQPAASDALDGICSHCPAAKLGRYLELAPREQSHDGDCQQRDNQSGEGKSLAVSRPQGVIVESVPNRTLSRIEEVGAGVS